MAPWKPGSGGRVACSGDGGRDRETGDASGLRKPRDVREQMTPWSLPKECGPRGSKAHETC